MTDRPFGARFVAEVRRLTDASWGLGSGEVERLTHMNREAFLSSFAGTTSSSKTLWGIRDPAAADPETLARAFYERGRRSNLLDDLINLLGGFA